MSAMCIYTVKYRYSKQVRRYHSAGMDSDFSHWEAAESVMRLIAPYKDMALLHINYQFRNDERFSVISCEEETVHVILSAKYRLG
jgi:hypothetical protein